MSFNEIIVKDLLNDSGKIIFVMWWGKCYK